MPIGGKPLNSVSEICHATLNCRIDVGSPLPTGRKRCLLYGKIRGESNGRKAKCYDLDAGILL